MNRVRASLVAVLVGALLIGAPGVRALADINNATGTNVQGGDNRGTTNQGGKSASGAAVGGQVTGVVTGGRTSVDARNVSKDSSVESGDANAGNTANSFVGLSKNSSGNALIGSTTDLSFIGLNDHANLQDGNNRQTLTQTANATSGDGVAGEVIGVVTAAGGSTSVVAANTTNNSDVTSGDARSDNNSAAFVGLANVDDELGVGASDISNVTGGRDNNIQNGSNRQTASQSANSTTGDGVAGQVIGVVNAGAASVDANNTSDNNDVQTGDARSSNSSGAFVGLAFTEEDDIEVNPADISNVNTTEHLNVQDGNNRQTVGQRATSTSGDGVAGEVIGDVTAAGGSSSIVAANTSKDSDVTTGDARSSNDAAAFVGLGMADDELEIGNEDITNVHTPGDIHVQDGNNRQTANQTSTASTGDGIAGQVIGAVSAGATSIDAKNTSDNVSAQTGDTTAANNSNGFVGLAFTESDSNVEVGADITNVGSSGDHAQVQEGNNRQTIGQNASATSGDGVAGEVIGAVTSAGGSASIVAANSSKNSDVTTGDAHATNSSGAFVGLASANEVVDVTDINGVNSSNSLNVQEGDNRQTAGQTSTASTGDGVVGQVIGAVAAGRTSIDANNSSDDVSVQTGDAHADNDSHAFVGLARSRNSEVEIGPGDISGITSNDGADIQEGSNRQTIHQTATATTGDGVAGEVIGAVTSAGGSASIVAANTSTTSDVTTGDARSTNDSTSLIGLAKASSTVDVGDISGIHVDPVTNVQEGRNRQTLSQTATASTGDGVAGQVLGVVSAGAASLDANNKTVDSSVQTGDANASNAQLSVVGLALAAGGNINIFDGASEADITGVGPVDNLQEGNNTQTLSQTANAATGDGVAGQVAGVVTSAGGSASVVLANTSTSIDSTTGDTRFDNSGQNFVGLAFANGALVLG